MLILERMVEPARRTPPIGAALAVTIAVLAALCVAYRSEMPTLVLDHLPRSRLDPAIEQFERHRAPLPANDHHQRLRR